MTNEHAHLFTINKQPDRYIPKRKAELYGINLCSNVLLDRKSILWNSKYQFDIGIVWYIYIVPINLSCLLDGTDCIFCNSDTESINLDAKISNDI